MGELEKLVSKTEQAILAVLKPPTEFSPCKVSVWIKLVKPARVDGVQMEETVGNVHKVMLEVNSVDELVREVADNVVVAVFGGDVPLVRQMPNLIVKVFDSKAYVPMEGAPPLDAAGQMFLKATVYRWEPSLWDQLFKK